MSDWTGHEAETIAAELARVVLGGRGSQRPEQRMDAWGAVYRAGIAIRIAQMDAAQRLIPAVRRIVEFMQAHPEIRKAAERGEQ